MFIDIAVSDECKNPDSYGEICVQCNMCRRFCEGCARQDESFCNICSRNPDITDQWEEE